MRETERLIQELSPVNLRCIVKKCTLRGSLCLRVSVALFNEPQANKSIGL